LPSVAPKYTSAKGQTAIFVVLNRNSTFFFIIIMTLLAINWADVGIQGGQLLLSLSILVILHEFGHYITARWFGCRVERFFLFFVDDLKIAF
jgi:hypothetical protein